VILLLGVKVHSGIKFTGLVEPKNANSGWTVTVSPSSSVVSSQIYNILVAADGKQHSVPGFHSKEFRAKLALAITVNFVNHNTKQESSVPEISGVSYVYNQQFFDTLAEKHGIDLENIVYYKDETHYFVMTAKKRSLLKKKVLKMVRVHRVKIVQWILSTVVTYGTSIFSHYKQVAALCRWFCTGLVQLGPAVVTKVVAITVTTKGRPHCSMSNIPI